MTALAVPAKATGVGSGALAWALGFAAVAGLAALNLDRLNGGLAFFVAAWPLDMLAGRPVADAAQAAMSIVVAFLVSFGMLYVSKSESAHLRTPVAASVFGVLLVCESLYLAVGAMPRHRFGELATGLYLPWHLAALGLTVVYLFSPQARRLLSVRAGFWLAVFVLCLAVLFPWTDSL